MKKIFSIHLLARNACILTILLCFYSTCFSHSLHVLKENTDSIVAISKLENPNHTLSNAALIKARQLAQERRTIILNTIKKNPSQIASFILTNTVISKLPKIVQAYMEEEVSDIKGTLEIRAAVSEHDPEMMEFVLFKDDGTIYYLHFMDKIPSDFKTGQKIRVLHAYLIANMDHYHPLVLTSKDVVIEHNTGSPIPEESFGDQPTVVFLFNFEDQPNDRPFSVADVNTLFFKNISNQFLEFSYQQARITGKVVGWSVIPVQSSTECYDVVDRLPAFAEQAAKAAGVDLTPYVHRVYILPQQICLWLGKSSVGKRLGNYSDTWLNGLSSFKSTIHEMGHAMGLSHSHLLKCAGTSNTGSCGRIEYGDYTDSMSFGLGAHYNAYQKEALGWLNYNVSPPIQTVTTSGSYSVYPLESQNKNVKALKILKKSSFPEMYYYIEYRQPIGYDSILDCAGCDYTKGILIRHGVPYFTHYYSSDLLDMSPNDNNNQTLVALLPGQSFSDPNAANGGFTLRVDSVTPTQANVTITYGVAPLPPTNKRIPM